METYYSVSLNGRFVFRTDTQGLGEQARARTEAALSLLQAAGYEITRYDRPTGWITTQIKEFA